MRVILNYSHKHTAIIQPCQNRFGLIYLAIQFQGDLEIMEVNPDWYVIPIPDKTENGVRVKMFGRGTFIQPFKPDRLAEALLIIRKDFRHVSKMVLDLSDMLIIDVHGMTALLDAYQALRQQGCKFEVINVHPKLRRNIERTGIDHTSFFPITYLPEAPNDTDTPPSPA
jgi:anti-anti-sigma factor